MEVIDLVIDTVNKQIKVPEDKMIVILSELHKWTTRSVSTKRQLLSFIRKLSFISQTV